MAVIYSNDFPNNSRRTTTIYTDASTDLGTTIYGGTLDFVSGVLTVDRASVDLGTLTWTSNATNRYQSDSLNGVKNVVTDVSVADNLMCSAYDVSPANNTPIGGISSFTSDGTTYIRVMDDRYPSIYTFTQGVTGVQLVYELATTYTVQLTPTQVRSLLGANNVWSDSGEMEKIIYNKGTTTLSLTIADLYNIIANLDARVKELEGKDEIDLSTMSDKDLDEMPEEEEAEEETAEET